jgi:DNA (cytosine-5)-methyltransferase 1
MGKPDTLTAIDLFAGAGGFSLAARTLGIRVRIAVEVDPHAANSYHRNFIYRRTLRPLLLRSDIREVDWDQTLDLAGLVPGECSILMGGPPCQGFSSHRIKGAGIGDPRNELLTAYFGALAAIQPRAFVVENVSGILWERHAAYLRTFLAAAEDIGYRVMEPTILNARDFGIPQNRKRVFIIGWRSDLNVAPHWPPPSTHFPTSDTTAKKTFVPASTVFVSPLAKNDPNAVHINHSEEMRRVFRSTPKDGGSRADSDRVLPCHKGHDGHRDVYGRIRLNQPGPTMTTACINPSKGRFLHPLEDHGITARHAARFQGFPDDFVFEGGLFASARQIGNAVPPLLGQHVLACLSAALTSGKRFAGRRGSR